MEFLKEKTTFTSKKDGKQVTCYRYYLLTDNGYKLFVKPVFGEDKKAFYCLAKEKPTANED
ncbi:MAG: hypothetical protein QXY78_03930 [Thermoplasmata archaeon]